jgi:hypothetical protein
MAVVVTMLSILRGIRVPDGMLIHYPCLITDIQHFYPSSLYSLDDPLLSTSFIKYCLQSIFKKGGNPKNNPIFSPIYA